MRTCRRCSSGPARAQTPRGTAIGETPPDPCRGTGTSCRGEQHCPARKIHGACSPGLHLTGKRGHTRPNHAKCLPTAAPPGVSNAAQREPPFASGRPHRCHSGSSVQPCVVACRAFMHSSRWWYSHLCEPCAPTRFSATFTKQNDCSPLQRGVALTGRSLSAPLKASTAWV